MWVRLWITFSVSTTVLSQQNNNKLHQSGADYEWGWLTPGAGEGSVGQYYVRLPQSEQRVVYTADGSGYHGAVALNTSDGHHVHTQTFALGQKAIDLNAQQEQAAMNQQNPTQKNNLPVDIFLLQQLSHQYVPNFYNQPLYNINTEHPNDSSKPLRKEAKIEHISPVQIYKDHNCTNEEEREKEERDKEEDTKEIQSDLKKSQDLFTDVSSYNWKNVNGNFGVKTKHRDTDRSEKFYYTELTDKATQDGINRLVASTQDLISNDDLLKINNAIEQHLREHGDDLIKPKSHESLETSPTMITVQAKISNILKGINAVNAEILQTDSNGYKFSTPIVVADSPKNVQSQMFDNVVTTVVPYLEDGYQIVGINSNSGINSEEYNDSEENLVSVTPRPIGSNYLAPLTVALRLLNDNGTFDHEGSESEFVDSVTKPKQKTLVEVQESIPLDVTHINEVEVHEYLDEGRANSETYNIAKSLYDKLSTSLQLKNNLNNILNKYNTMNNEGNKQNQYGDSKEQLETSENIQSQIQIPLEANNQRSGLYNYYENTNENFEVDDQRIIQPIIIEKQVPVTKFVNRYIEKQVPYPEAVAVPIPVDRPVPYAVHVEKVVEKPVEVTKYVDKPYPVQVPYPVEVKVPYPVHQKVYVDRPVHIGYPVEKIIENNVVHPVPVPTPYGVPVEVPYPVEHKILYPFPVDRPVPYPVEVEKPVEKVVQKEVPVPYPVDRKVPYPVPYETRVPVPYPVEKKVPVDRIVERPVHQVVEKHIRVPVPHPVPVHVHHPYPVEKIVEKKVPYPVHVDRIVERKVPIKVPYPVEKIVEKIVEKPVVVTKYVDKPYPVEKLVPYPVEVKVPYQYENNDLQVSYRYKATPAESQNHPQYKALEENDFKQKQIQNLKNQYDQYVKETQKDKKEQQLKSQYNEYVKNLDKTKTKPQLLQTTHWGNHYASSYQYVNNSNNYNPNSVQENYVNHFTNSHGPSQKPSQEQNQQNQYEDSSQNKNSWDKNKAYQYGQNYNQYVGQNNNYQVNQNNQNSGQSQNKNYEYSQSGEYIDLNKHKNYQHGQNDQYEGQSQNNDYKVTQKNQNSGQSQNYKYSQSGEYIDLNKHKNYQHGLNDQYEGQSQNNNYQVNQNYQNSGQSQNKNYEYSQSGEYIDLNKHKNYQHGQNDQYLSQSQNNNYQYGQNYDQHISQSKNKHYPYSQYDQYASQSQNWDKNKNYLVEYNVRRTDRVPKVTIEYGFKPPLIPSTEVDLDGLPINKSD